MGKQQANDKNMYRVLALPRSEQGDFRKRLKKIMLSANGIGWGYHDGLCDEYYEAFHDDE